MTGLASWVRDSELPAAAGDVELCPPNESSALELFRQHLDFGPQGAPSSAQWVYARWKPGIACCSAYRLTFADGSSREVVLKRHAGHKAGELARSRALASRDLERAFPEAVLPERGLHLWALPGDRELPGLPRVLELHRTAKLLRGFPGFDAWAIRWSSSSAEILRYKPERRAVVRLDLVVRQGSKSGPKSRLCVGARVHPVQVALRIADARRALEQAGRAEIGPRFLGAEERTGLVFEEWLDALQPASDLSPDSAADLAGRALGALHAAPGPSMPAHESAPLAALAPYWRVGSIHAELALRIVDAPRSPAARTWVHGDFHLDQVFRRQSTERAVLLDLDLAGGGDPLCDLASWCADRLAGKRSTTLSQALDPLLAGYRRAVDRKALAERVAVELARRAAASLRRLELGALTKSRELLERALAVQESQT